MYIGSLYRWKGAERLGEYGEHLLRDDPQSRLLIVGPVGDTAAAQAGAEGLSMELLRQQAADGDALGRAVAAFAAPRYRDDVRDFWRRRTGIAPMVSP